MSDPQIVCVTTIRETLVTYPEIQTLLPYGVGQYKIFWETVEDFVPLPYIVISHILGGDEQSTQVRAIDAYFKVEAHSGDLSTVTQLMSAIHKMDRTRPTIVSYAEGNPDDNPVYRPYAQLRATVPTFERDVAQNVPYFKAGGIYRIQLIRQEGT